MALPALIASVATSMMSSDDKKPVEKPDFSNVPAKMGFAGRAFDPSSFTAPKPVTVQAVNDNEMPSDVNSKEATGLLRTVLLTLKRISQGVDKQNQLTIEKNKAEREDRLEGNFGPGQSIAASNDNEKEPETSSNGGIMGLALLGAIGSLAVFGKDLGAATTKIANFVDQLTEYNETISSAVNGISNYITPDIAPDTPADVANKKDPTITVKDSKGRTLGSKINSNTMDKKPVAGGLVTIGTPKKNVPTLQQPSFFESAREGAINFSRDIWNAVSGSGQGIVNIYEDTDEAGSKDVNGRSAKGSVGRGAATGSYASLKRVIMKAESNGGDPDIIHSEPPNWKRSRKRLTEMTINEVLKYTRKVAARDGKGGSSGAAGMFQFIPSTLAETVKAAGLSGNELFNVETQNRLADVKIQQKIGNRRDPRHIQYALAQEWAGLPVPIGFRIKNGNVSNGRMSYYQGVQGNKATVSSDETVRAIRSMSGGAEARQPTVKKPPVTPKKPAPAAVARSTRSPVSTARTAPVKPTRVAHNTSSTNNVRQSVSHSDNQSNIHKASSFSYTRDEINNENMRLNRAGDSSTTTDARSYSVQNDSRDLSDFSDVQQSYATSNRNSSLVANDNRQTGGATLKKASYFSESSLVNSGETSVSHNSADNRQFVDNSAATSSSTRMGDMSFAQNDTVQHGDRISSSNPTTNVGGKSATTNVSFSSQLKPVAASLQPAPAVQIAQAPASGSSTTIIQGGQRQSEAPMTTPRPEKDLGGLSYDMYFHTA